MAIKKKPIIAPDHFYVPKHEIMPIAEAQKVLEKFHCKPTELPLIFVTAPAIIARGVKPGDMIKNHQKKCNCGREPLL